MLGVCATGKFGQVIVAFILQLLVNADLGGVVAIDRHALNGPEEVSAGRIGVFAGRLVGRLADERQEGRLLIGLNLDEVGAVLSVGFFVEPLQAFAIGILQLGVLFHHRIDISGDAGGGS